MNKTWSLSHIRSILLMVFTTSYGILTVGSLMFMHVTCAGVYWPLNSWITLLYASLCNSAHRGQLYRSNRQWRWPPQITAAVRLINRTEDKALKLKSNSTRAIYIIYHRCDLLLIFQEVRFSLLVSRNCKTCAISLNQIETHCWKQTLTSSIRAFL